MGIGLRSPFRVVLQVLHHAGNPNPYTDLLNPGADHPAIIARCAALGLSLDQVKRLAGVDHALQDLAHVLGLDAYTLTPLKPRRWLWMAAQTCSVSYWDVLTSEALLAVLTTGTLLPDDAAMFLYFLEEAPLSIVVMAIEQAALLALAQN